MMEQGRVQIIELEKRLNKFSFVSMNARRITTGVQMLDSDNSPRYFLANSEFRILYEICTYGHSNPVIAEKLDLSVQTVRNYITRIFQEVFPASKKLEPDLELRKTMLIAKLVTEGVVKYEAK